MADDKDREKERVSEFLNPKSMLTPGICGAVIMTITNACGAAFGMVGLSRTFFSLGLSFLIGTLVFAARAKSIWQKAVFYVLNSLIIFSMATGTNSAGKAAVSASSGASTNAPSSLLETQVVARVVTTNIHRLTNVGHAPILITNYSTNFTTRPLQPERLKVKPRFFEQWH